MGPAQVAPAYRFPKGKPVLLLIGGKGDPSVVRVAAEMQRSFAGKVYVTRLASTSGAGRDALKQFSIELKPAYVLADSNGHVVLKSEGSVEPAPIRAKLEAMAGSGRK